MSGRSAVRILLPLVSTDFSHDFVGKFAPSREPPAERLDETLVTLPPFRLRRRLCGIRQWRRAGQPESDEQSQRLVGNVDVSFKPLDLPRHPVKPPRQRALQAIGAVRREMGRQRRLDDQGLRRPLRAA